VGVIVGGAVACAGETIVFVGMAEECRRQVALDPSGRRIDARGGVVLPGFVDAHTHLPFGGWRDDEFEKRLAGATYQEIAAAGGGILSTVRATRALGAEALAALVRIRLDAMLAAGTTTVEAKSGYGLSHESEIAILKCLASVQDHPVEVRPTFLGAHVVAPEYRDGRRAQYVSLVAEKILPDVAARGLARFCDVFIDEGAFTVQEARLILDAARGLGMGVRVHAEQLTRTGATRLAINLGAFSVDHLERLDAGDVAALATAWSNARAMGREGPADRLPAPGAKSAKSASKGRGSNEEGTASALRAPVAVVLPGASYFLRASVHPPVRELIAAGVPVAVATDFNPGTSPCLAMPPILSLACLLFGMTPDEAIAAATRHGALALGIEDRVGTIEAGKQADLAIWDVPGRRHLAYRVGPVPCAVVIKRGRIVALEGRRVPAPGAHATIRGGAMLVDLTTRQLLDKLASDAPTPGGGSASALAGAQAAALVEMVAALTLGNEKYAASRSALEPIRTKAATYRAELAGLVDRDAEAYDGVVAAMRLPKQTDEEKAARKAARQRALQYAAEIPLKTAEISAAVSDLAAAAAPHANPSAGSDLLVAAMLAQAALGGAAANVRINLGGLANEEFAARANERLQAWSHRAAENLSEIGKKLSA